MPGGVLGPVDPEGRATICMLDDGAHRRGLLPGCQLVERGVRICWDALLTPAIEAPPPALIDKRTRVVPRRASAAPVAPARELRAMAESSGSEALLHVQLCVTDPVLTRATR